MTTTIEDLKRAIFGTTLGFAVRVDGFVNVDTVASTISQAISRALFVHGIIAVGCDDPSCDCLPKALAKFIPTAEVVQIKVEVAGK